MKYQFTKQLKVSQTQTFNAKLYDSLEFLKLSSEEIIENILQLMQENPLLEVEFNTPSLVSLDDNFDTISEKESLKKHLYYQLHTSSHLYSDYVCSYIIEALDHHGFFNENIHEFCKQLNIDEATLLTNLEFIQSFEPTGVAAKNSTHALILQCEKDKQILAASLLRDFSKEIMSHNYKKIATVLHIKSAKIEEAVAYIRTLNPFPCADYNTDHHDMMIPELKIEIIDQQVLLSPIHYYHITYNDVYMDLVKQNPILKKYLNDSKTILANLDKRNATLMLVANELVKIQYGHFLYGDELEVCRQADVASRLGINPSTVSRAVASKFYEFNNHCYPLADLFVSSTEQGDSSDAIKKAILEIIENEDKQKPYSDEKICEKLKIYNFDVSRRTINKYRKSLNILSANKRKSQ